jgi:flagellar P-ring protein FlgI
MTRPTSLLARLLRALASPSAMRAPATVEERLALGRELARLDAERLAERRRADALCRRAALAAESATPFGDLHFRAGAGDASNDVSLPPGDARRETPLWVEAVGPARRQSKFSIGVVPLADMPSADRAVRLLGALLLAAAAALPGAPLGAQDAKVKDLTIAEGAAPIRLVGYGLVVGLDGTGDRGTGSRGSGMTVQSVTNILRRFDVEVPAEMMRTRNVAAVLVTAEVSPYLRSGGRFDVHVSSLGDARSLRGGVLWMTPLVAEAGGQPLAAAQGALLLSEAVDPRDRFTAPTVETTARLVSGGQLESDLPRPTFAGGTKLLLKEPDVGTAAKIAAAINGALGAKTATVEDPGAIALALPDSGDRATLLARVRDLSIRPDRSARVVIDARDGTVVAGGDMTVGDAVVSHGAVTLTIGGMAAAAPAATPNAPAAPAAGADTTTTPGDVRIATGTSVQRVAAALHAVQTPPSEIAAIFAALKESGALVADVVVR